MCSWCGARTWQHEQACFHEGVQAPDACRGERVRQQPAAAQARVGAHLQWAEGRRLACCAAAAQQLRIAAREGRHPGWRLRRPQEAYHGYCVRLQHQHWEDRHHLQRRDKGCEDHRKQASPPEDLDKVAGCAQPPRPGLLLQDALDACAGCGGGGGSVPAGDTFSAVGCRAGRSPDTLGRRQPAGAGARPATLPPLGPPRLHLWAASGGGRQNI